MDQKLIDALADLREEETLSVVREMLEDGEDPVKILELSRKGMNVVGDRFERGEYFLSELVVAAAIFKQVTELMRPELEKAAVEPVGQIVIGTVQGDIHDIGKNIAIALLDAAGFEVHDLGVDVPPEKFVDAIEDLEPEIVGMSGLLTLAIESMRKSVEAISRAGLRERVKIIVGSGRVDETAREYIGADAWTDEAATGVKICSNWIGGE
jgi:methanogenic corrinoid protein MtbC1